MDGFRTGQLSSKRMDAEVIFIQTNRSTPKALATNWEPETIVALHRNESDARVSAMPSRNAIRNIPYQAIIITSSPHHGLPVYTRDIASYKNYDSQTALRKPHTSFRCRVVSGSDRNLESGFDPGANIPKAGSSRQLPRALWRGETGPKQNPAEPLPDP
ncbi:UNVERIFIED_CONTAM: hypothetical protein K2H54_054776 [Gekko kuhli]